MTWLKQFFGDIQTQVLLLGVLLAAVAWAFQRWLDKRRPKLSARATELLAEIDDDSRSSRKGLTIFQPRNSDGKGDYFPYRWDSQRMTGLAVREINLEPVLSAVGELVAHDYLSEDEVVDDNASASYTRTKRK